MYFFVYMYITYIHTYIHTYIQRERESERGITFFAVIHSQTQFGLVAATRLQSQPPGRDAGVR